MNFIEGGVCSPKGFKASGVNAEVKIGSKKRDLALILSEYPCVVSGLFTQNVVKAEPVKYTKNLVNNNFENIRGVVANSGNANACTGEQGMKNVEKTAENLEKQLSLPQNSILVCSTGVIGVQLRIDAVEKAIPSLIDALSKDGNVAAREAIMTTDTKYKELATSFKIDGKDVTIGTMAKGSGMIHINLGTMLGFITTDIAITKPMLQKALIQSVDCSYNCVSVDGDTSTNDTLLIFANGQAGNKVIDSEGKDFDTFVDALCKINIEIAKKIAADGEGAEHLIECKITGAKSVASARKLAKSVISSSLVKAMFFGKDANWGRVLCALGYSGELFDPAKVAVSFSNSKGTIPVCKNGVPFPFDEEKATTLLSEPSTSILIEMSEGNCEGTAWGCDLTYNYVKINGDYRS